MIGFGPRRDSKQPPLDHERIARILGSEIVRTVKPGGEMEAYLAMKDAATLYEFTIPRYHLPRANQWRGRHWTVAHRLRDEAADLLGGYAKKAGVPQATCKRGVKVILSGSGRGDRDGPEKLTLDALKQAGLIVDDSPEWLEGRMQVEFQKSKVKSTTVVLWDVE